MLTMHNAWEPPLKMEDHSLSAPVSDGSLLNRSISAPPPSSSVGGVSLGDLGAGMDEQTRELLFGLRGVGDVSSAAADPHVHHLNVNVNVNVNNDATNFRRSVGGDHLYVTSQNHAGLSKYLDGSQRRGRAEGPENDYDFESSASASPFGGVPLDRPKSAAPQMSLRSPPGMADPGLFRSSEQDAVYRTGANVKRPASAGLLSTRGVGSSLFHGGAEEGHADEDGNGEIPTQSSKTLMELIHEDFPKTPSPEFAVEGPNGANHRPRSASPPRTHGAYFPEQSQVAMPQKQQQGAYSYLYAGQQDVNGRLGSHHAPSQILTVTHNPVPAPTPSNAAQYLPAPMPQTHPDPTQNPPVIPQSYHPQSTTQTIYSSHGHPPPSHHLPPQFHPGHHPYEIQTIYYPAAPTAQRQHPPGNDPPPPPTQHVYVNTSPYFAVQYAQHPSAHLNQMPQHQYVSVVHPGLANNGNYAPQWQQQTPQHQQNGTAPARVARGPKNNSQKPHRNTNRKPNKKFTPNESDPSSKYKSALEMKTRIAEFCRDQNGSRFLQQRLEIAEEQEKNLILSEVLPEIYLLRNDVFGNYVVQKLLERGTPFIKDEIYQTLVGEMVPLSLQTYGCRVVQKALETLPSSHIHALLSEFHGNTVNLIHDQNGNHVIQKCVEVLSEKARTPDPDGDTERLSDELLYVLDDVLSDVSALSKHPYGCRVMQRVLEHCPSDQKDRVLEMLRPEHRRLLDDQYGNYVIQHVLQYGHSADRDSILKIVLAGGLLPLSRQKFASNVVEKLLKYGAPSHCNEVVKRMLQVSEEEGVVVVLLMVRDAYANYVVQTTLDVVRDGEWKQKLLEELKGHAVELRNYTFAKHIVAKLSEF